MKEPNENKSKAPSSPAPLPEGEGSKTVRVKIMKGCLIVGYGVGECFVDMPVTLAKQYERDGCVTILNKGE